MSSMFIKINARLYDSPEVAIIANQLDINELDVIGRLIRVWEWIDCHLQDCNEEDADHTLRIAEGMLDRSIGINGFVQAMREVGWVMAPSDIYQWEIDR